MKLSEKRLSESILRKSILKELKYILNNFKLLKELGDNPATDRWVDNRMKAVHDEAEERRAEEQARKKYCASEEGRKDPKCFDEDTLEWAQAYCSRKPGTIAMHLQKATNEMNIFDIFKYGYGYKVYKNWKCVKAEPDIKCPDTVNPYTKQKMRPLQDPTTGEYFCSDAVTGDTQEIEYYSKIGRAHV